MKPRYTFCLLFVALLTVALSFATPPAPDDDEDGEFKGKVKEEETIQKTFSFPATGARSVEVDNVFGSIDVVGTASDQVRLVVKKTIRARSQADIEQAKKEVTLDISQPQNKLRVYVDGPFRCHHGWARGCVDERHYIVHYDFTLQVPQRVDFDLKTVNGGSIRVQKVRGDYFVENVNGPIALDEVGGSGHVHTVNGDVKVTFVENPKQDSDFGTINGDIDLYFAPQLAADFRFKTMQGNIYSDFPMTAVPAAAGKAERKNGRFVYSADRYTGGRVGTGGPEIKLENLNGDLRVLARANQTQ